MARVLIVDDEASYREHLGRFLSRMGHEVRSAATPKQAIELAEELPPQVLLADWMLKGRMDGLQLGEHLRQANPGLRIVLMTGFPSSEIREEAGRAGIDGLLEKPFGLAEAAEAVAGLQEDISDVESD
jgi:CheY-like chemotaxis protein